MKNSLAQLCSFGTQQKIVIFNKKNFFSACHIYVGRAYTVMP